MLRNVPLNRLNGLADPAGGLSAADAASRRARFGANDIVLATPSGWRVLLGETLRDPMLWFLLLTGALFAVLGEAREAAVLLAAILPLVFMDAYLHRRTQASTAGLSRLLATTARVRRDGGDVTIPAGDLVPGDLVLVDPGNPFPADGILVAADSVKCDAPAFPGAPFPGPTLPGARRARRAGGAAVDAEHWGFAGTRLLTGSAALRVVFTGAETLYGEIVRSAQAGPRARTPLQQAVAKLVSVLLVGAITVCLLLAVIRLQQGFGPVDALVSAATLAVAALPEEFPIVLTFFLGVGVYRLARKRALVRRAIVVESIGRVSCICTDKTGTLTLGTLRLAHLIPAEGGGEATLLTTAAEAARRETGDPLDLAILDRVDAEPGAGGAPGADSVAIFPFTEERRRETRILRDGDRGARAAVKGAPETVLPLCDLDDAARQAWHARVDGLAASGHKVIACASLRLPADWAGGEPDRGFALAGLLAFEDPVRDGAAAAVRAAREAGIKVVMVTGDHPATAAAVAAEIGLSDDHAPDVVTGAELAAWPRAGLAERLRRVDVVARAAPAQKLSLVRAFQEMGEIVAVTGDGVNDVPALQAADIGIAMGERGTQSAREVAAIVLLDDNFCSIVGAIAEGRQLFANLQRSFAYLLMIHIPLVATAALVPIAGYPLLYLPIHIVWLELIIHPTALLVFQELPARGPLRAVERSAAIRFFSPRQWLVVAVVGLLLALMVMLGYQRSLGAGREVEHARAMALVALVIGGAALSAGLSGLRTPVSRVVSAATLASALLFVQWPPLAALLHLAPLDLDDWALAALGGCGAALPVIGFRLGRGGGRDQRPRAAINASASSTKPAPPRDGVT